MNAVSKPAALVRAIKVLHVIASASPVRGGTSTAVWTILDALRQSNVEAELVTTDDDGPDRRLPVALDRFVGQHGFKVRYFPRQTRLYSASVPLASWLSANVRSYDLVHVHGVFGFVPVFAAKIARVRGVPYVLSPHGMLERWGRENVRSWVKKTSVRFLEGPALVRASAVHYTSESEWQQARELGFPMRHAIFPLALQQNDERCADLSKREPETRDANTILFLSRIDVKKGLDLLLEAFARLTHDRPALRLVIAGTGPDALTAELKQHAVSLGIAHRIEWTGFVQGVEKRRLLERATLFVLPSRSENFGYAVAEAMSAGLPVVVTKAVGISDLVQRVGAGRVAEVTVESIASELALVLSNPARGRMGRAGRDAVRTELSIAKFGSRLAELYASILRT